MWGLLWALGGAEWREGATNLTFSEMGTHPTALIDCSKSAVPTRSFRIPMPDCHEVKRGGEKEPVRMQIHRPIIVPHVVNVSLCKMQYNEVTTWEDFVRVRQINEAVKQWKVPSKTKCAELGEQEEFSEMEGLQQFGKLEIQYAWMQHVKTTAEIYYKGYMNASVDLNSGKLLSASGTNDQCSYQDGECDMGAQGYLFWEVEDDVISDIKCPVALVSTEFCVGEHEGDLLR